MRSVIIIAGGLAVLGLFALVAWRFGGGAQAVVTAAKIFIPNLARRSADQYVDRSVAGRIFGGGGVADLPRHIRHSRCCRGICLVEVFVIEP